VALSHQRLAGTFIMLSIQMPDVTLKIKLVKFRPTTIWAGPAIQKSVKGGQKGIMMMVCVCLAAEDQMGL